ncbi:small ribosomal subunit protein mS34-like [Liolophura sinensis]|uniref:small ribosomal subunit protein mS34-like n=1 Tax=Liolophura sinensis TaxID=3198878 RepID=UPI0031580A1C
MLIKYVGRPSPWKGKTLYNIACNLKNRGEGRVVIRWSFANRYPEKCFYRLTKVEPDTTDPEFMRGSAWGLRVFRGKVYPKETKIETGNRADWRLIPREEEEEFCKLTEKDVYKRPEPPPREMTLPPLLGALYKQHLENKGESVEGPITVSLRLRRTKERNSATDL